jgi:hypothetical protein
MRIVDPEAPGERRDQPHAGRGELVARGPDAQLVEVAVHAHERDLVARLRTALEVLRQLDEALALVRRRALRGAEGDHRLHRAAQLEHPQLAPHVDRRDRDAAPRLDADQVLARETLQRFANRRAADAELFRQHRFGHDDPCGELPMHDQLLERRVRLVGQRDVAVRRARAARGPRRRWLIARHRHIATLSSCCCSAKMPA